MNKFLILLYIAGAANAFNSDILDTPSLIDMTNFDVTKIITPINMAMPYWLFNETEINLLLKKFNIQNFMQNYDRTGYKKYTLYHFFYKYFYKGICLLQYSKVFSCNESKIDPFVNFNLFTDNSGNYRTIDRNNAAQCPNSNKLLKIIIHGYNDSSSEKWIQEMNNEYYKKGGCSVIAVDWSVLASYNYIQAAADTKCVGNIVGKFILYLQKICEIPRDNIHIIGHSLGAHIGGFSGKFSQIDGYKIGRVTGLDAAGPGFCSCFCENRLCNGDARMVDNLHTDDYKFGCVEAKAYTDFFANGGMAIQPIYPDNDCLGNPAKILACSHLAAIKIFAASINNNTFIAYRCENGNCNYSEAEKVGENYEGVGQSGRYYFRTDLQ